MVKSRPRKVDSWSSPPGTAEQLDDTPEPSQVLAAHIADQIHSWIFGSAEVPGDDPTAQLAWISDTRQPGTNARRVRAGDVLILLRKRGPYADQLIKALQQRGVPVAGADRLQLLDQLAVKDLLALADFALQPHDDLTLATLLRSPVVELDDQKLEDLCWQRDQDGLSLWDQLRLSEVQVSAWLAQQVQLASELAPYEVLSQALLKPCPGGASGLAQLRARLGEDVVDPINELLSLARSFEREHPPSLQQFLVWIRKTAASVKRDLETGEADEHSQGEVRVMTAHASKGLESPIVILADAYQNSAETFGNRLLWAKSSSQGLPGQSYPAALPIWAPSTQDDSQHSTLEKAEIERAQTLESRRLLYVALTRAEERLHIYGLQPDSESERMLERGWYAQIKRGLEAVGEPSEVSLIDTPAFTWSGTKVIHRTGELSIPAQLLEEPWQKSRPQVADQPSMPTSLAAQVPVEPALSRPLSPSRLDDDGGEPTIVAPSPLSTTQRNRFQRGNLLHSLFRMLPDVPGDQRLDLAQRFLSKPAHALGQEQIKALCDEAFSVLDHPHFASLFGPFSKAEVPLGGIVDDQPFAGQVDRLVEVRDEQGQVIEVQVVDFKTNRPPPTSPNKIPPIYRKQMAAYARILEQIYPRARIRPLLLWTDQARLMEVEGWRDINIPGTAAGPEQRDQPTLPGLTHL